MLWTPLRLARRTRCNRPQPCSELMYRSKVGRQCLNRMGCRSTSAERRKDVDNADGYVLDVYSRMGTSDCHHRDADLVCCANPALRKTTEGLMASTLLRRCNWKRIDICFERRPECQHTECS